MKKSMIVLVAIVLLALPSAVTAGGPTGNGTLVFRFSNEPFVFDQCYSLAAPFPPFGGPGPALTFGQDVCVHYVAMNSETVRVDAGDVSWSLIQHGIATVQAVNGGTVLYRGPFQVEEVARDIGGDANCLAADGHAWIGNCTALYTKMDRLSYHWKVTGASIYYFDLSISAPGQWCASSKQGGELGPGCK
jgi:hypothetical protein